MAYLFLDYQGAYVNAGYGVDVIMDKLGNPLEDRNEVTQSISDSLFLKSELYSAGIPLTEYFDYSAYISGGADGEGFTTSGTSDFSNTFQLQQILLSDGAGGYVTPESLGIVVTTASGLPSPNAIVPEPSTGALMLLAYFAWHAGNSRQRPTMRLCFRRVRDRTFGTPEMFSDVLNADWRR